MKGHLLDGVEYLFKGVRIIFSKGFKRFILLPLIINTIIFTTIIMVAATQLWAYFNSLTSEFPGWATIMLAWVLWILFTVAASLLTATLFVFITNLIAGPFYGFLAEKTEYRFCYPLKKEQTKFNKNINLGQNDKEKQPFLKRFIMEPSFFKEVLILIPRTILRELRKWLHFTPWMLVGLIFFIFPLTIPIAPFVWFLIMTWIISIEFIDYTADNQAIPFAHMLKVLKSEPLTVLGFGGIISFLISIPGLNLLIPPAAVAGGCKLWVHLHQKYNTSNNNNEKFNSDSKNDVKKIESS